MTQRPTKIRTDSAETVAHVRRVLDGSDPARGADHAEAAEDAEGQRVLARILADTQPDGGRRPLLQLVPGGRRRWTIVAATLLTLGAMGAAADAAGVIPTGVIKGLAKGDDQGAAWGKADARRAKMLVEARGSDGSRTQWWFAPGTKGGGCTYLRTLVGEKGKRVEDGSTTCSGPPEHVRPSSEDPLNVLYGPLANDWMGVHGRAAPPAVRIQVTLPSGERAFVAVKSDGYFMGVFDHKHGASPGVAEVAALDAKGRVLKAERVPETYG